MNEPATHQQPLRMLIATHAPLSLELGAGQVAINLGEAFSHLGHDVRVWSSSPAPLRRFNILPMVREIYAARKKLDRVLDCGDKFDTIDCPAIYVTQKVQNSGAVVVSRSVQPDILYLLTDLMQFRGWFNLLKKPFHLLDACGCLFYLLQGWQRSSSILCLGSLELQWMQKHFPWLKPKLKSYVNTLASDEQQLLSKIRSQRAAVSSSATKFLWIGRWVAHKGIDRLIDTILERTRLYPHDSFTIAGCGEDVAKDLLREPIESGRVKIVPKFDRQELFTLLQEHDVGLFTSVVEGWGLTLNEMLESGMIVYATLTGGVADLRNYFPETLRSFPLQSTISSPNNENCQWPEYYAHFSWQGIAERYLEIHRLSDLTPAISDCDRAINDERDTVATDLPPSDRD